MPPNTPQSYGYHAGNRGGAPRFPYKSSWNSGVISAPWAGSLAIAPHLDP